MDHLQTLQAVVGDVIAPQADTVDQTGGFPEAGVRALGEAGLLGLVSAPEVGGHGARVGDAARAVEEIGRACGSTAMVVCMHYVGTAVVEQHGDEATRRALADGSGLCTLAFSEAGSRSHFWVPLSTARAEGDAVRLDAHKSWVTSATRATHLVWSSRPLAAEGTSTLWLVPGDAAGLEVRGPFDGLGLRGNDSSPVIATGVCVPHANRLGADGAGMGTLLGTVLPRFNLLNAACSVGLMGGALERAIGHVSSVGHEHLGTALAELPTIRSYVAQARLRYDAARALWLDAGVAVDTGRDDALLRVLEAKAATGDAALEVMATAMRVCGGAAFRKDVGIERYFRDAQAASVMAPTSDQLYDFIGKALCGLPVF